MQTTKAQISQLSLESTIAKPNTCKKKKKKSCQTCVRGSRQFQRGGGEEGGGGKGGGGGRITSRGRFVPVFLLGNKWQLMIFMGRSGPPAPSVSTHIRVSNSLNSHFIYFIFLLGLVKFTKRLLNISADAKDKDSMILLRSKRPHTSIPATRCFKVWGRTWWWPWRKKMYITH